ncbi:MAG TPA: Sua5/YciO/YrdC/YwlC family protein [Gallionellaceae bacterium]|nr:Sua5/YciO/YrdC/YwlC family protein [Gallionellaceae bacterium]
MPRLPAHPRALAAHLRRGGLIAYPTEYCFGLGCDPSNRNAVKRLLALKQRPQHKGLILIAGRYAQLASYLQPITPAQQEQLRNDGAKAITYLMPVRHDAPRWLRGMHDTLAVRITAHSYAAALCNSLDMALVSTSANRSGAQPIRTYAECQRQFGHAVKVLNGRVGKNKKPSTIRVWGDGKIVRK